MVPYIENHTLDAKTLTSILTSLSLRSEAFLKWETDYFDSQLEETLRIAEERGGHED